MSSPFHFVLARRISERGSPVIPSLAPTLTKMGSATDRGSAEQYLLARSNALPCELKAFATERSVLSTDGTDFTVALIF